MTPRVGAKLWRRAMFKEPGLAVFGTRMQEIEHIAYALMRAERADIARPRVDRTGVGGADMALLVTTPAAGRAARPAPADEFTDALAAVWGRSIALARRRAAHGDLDRPTRPGGARRLDRVRRLRVGRGRR